MPMARHQLITCLWWNAYRSRFAVYASERVLDEASQGDSQSAQKRLDVIAVLSTAVVTQAAKDLAKLILLEAHLPAKAKADAEHIAIAAANGMDYLLTWNCKHLANPQITPKVARSCRRASARRATRYTSATQRVSESAPGHESAPGVNQHPAVNQYASASPSVRMSAAAA
jgi:hypothetical protein